MKHLIFQSRFLILLLGFMTFGISQVWGVEGDVHDFSASISQVLNNGASISSINIEKQSYPVKQINVIGNYNKSINPAVTITIKVDGKEWADSKDITAKENFSKEFSGASKSGAIEISFKNHCTASKDCGTFSVTKIQLVEGAPEVTVKSIKLSEAGVVSDKSVSGYYVGDKYALPTTSSQTCEDKTLVGWSTVEIATPSTKPTSNFYEIGEGAILAENNIFYAVYALKNGQDGAETENTSFDNSYGDYCGVNNGLKTEGNYIEKKNAWNNLSDQTIKIKVYHLSNSTSDELTISLVDNASNIVTSKTITTTCLGSASNKAGYSEYVSLQATSAVTGYRITLSKKNSSGTSVGKVKYQVLAACYEYSTKCCTKWSAPTLSYTASASIGAQLNPSWGAGTTHGTLTYSSSDEDVLEVNATSGVVTTKAAGTAHVIASWSSVDDNCDNSTESNEITVTAAYNITYKDKGGAVFSGTHEDGYPTTHTYGTATTLKSASKDYYTFNGWFADENCTGTAIQTVAADAYTADFTLYAKWAPIEYNINYTLNGGTNASGNPAKYTYETETITLQAPSKIGHDFQGWFKESTFENQVITIEKGSHGNVDLYAKWLVKNYTLTWDLNGGSVTTSGTAEGDVAYGTALTAPAVERTGYDFTGWKKGGVSVDFTQTVTMPAENATYVAQWTPQVYTISYQDKGGVAFSGSNLGSLPKKHTYNAETQLVDGVKAGYEFKGWFEDAACEGTAVVTIAGDAKTEDFTLYAKWEEILPTSFDVDVDNLTLVYDDANNNVGYIQVTFTPNNAFNREVKFEAVKNEGSVVTAYNYGGNDPKLRITANKEGEAIFKITSKRDESLTKTINITVKRLPVLTWKDAKGETVATTKATALTNGKVVLPKVEDYSKTPETCDKDYDHFMGWSATQFNATTDEPTLVEDGDDVNSDAETGDKTYYAVFAKGTGSPVKYTLVINNSDIAANNTYVIGHVTSGGDYYYLPTTSVTSNPVLKSLSVANNEISGEIAEDMPWTLISSNNNTYPYYIQSENQNTNYFYQNAGNGTSFRVGTTQMPWNIVKDDTYGWKITNNATYKSNNKTYGNPMYAVIFGTTEWRNYKDQTTNALSGAKFAIFKKSGGIEYHDFLTSCCQGYNVTLANEGVATGGTFSADVESACEGETVTLTATPATGYEFVQWTVKSDDEQTSYSVTDNKFEMPANGVKVSALFGKINYTVSLKRNFESTDDTYTTETFTYQETKALTTMATIGWTKTNYKFSGWSTTPSGSVEYVDGAEYKLEEAQNKTLYAIWTADDAQPISISQEHMTLTNAPTSISAAATQLKIDYTVATGYKITNVEVTVGGQPLTTIEYTQYQLVVNASDGFQGAVNITFTVEEIRYTVTINAGTGQCSTSEVVQSAYNTNITLPAASTVTAPADWEFAGWCATQITEQTDVIPTLLAAGSAYNPTTNTTIYAVYKQSKGDGGEIEYKFTFAEHEGWTTTGEAKSTSTPYYLLSKGEYVESPEVDLASITSISAKVDQYSNTGKFTLTAGTYTIASNVASQNTKTYKSTDESWPTMTGKGKVKLTDVDNSTTNGTRVYTITINCTTPSTYHYHSTPNVVVKVEVKTIATKNTRYKEGDMFNADGIVLTATYKDETTIDVTEGFTWNLTEALTPENTAVVFTYKNVSTEPTTISVGTLDHIALIQQPTKKEYTEGENFDSKGISVRAYYSNEAYQSVTSEVTYEPSTNLQAGTTQITVYYLKGTPKEKTCTIDDIIVRGKVATPVITPASGKVLTETEVSITCTTPEATIYYTTDNTNPTTASEPYIAPFKVQPGTTVRAYAVLTGWTDSEVAKAVYAEQPEFDKGDWLLVTDLEELEAGSYIIIANASNKVAMKSYVSGDYCAEANATFSQDGSMLTYNNAFGVFELRDYVVEDVKKGISFFDYNKETYLYYSGSSNTLKAQNNQDATAAWTVSQDENGMYVYNYTSTTRKIQDNHGSTRFACYTATQGEIQLYKYYKKVPKLIYDANGGSNAPVPSRSENGKAVVTDKQPTWGGYIFDKWTAYEDGSGKVYSVGEEVAITADLTIYAQWQEKQLEGTPVALVVKYGDKYYAMVKDLSAVEVEGIYNGNVVVVSEEVDQKSITWYRKDVEGGVTFQNCEEKYLIGGSSTTLSIGDDATTWAWDETNKCYAYSSRSFFTQGTEAFKNYAVSNISASGYSSAATCCESIRVGEVFTRDMSNGFMGTHCYPFDIAAGDYRGAQFYEIAYRIGNTRIYFDQVDHVEAGVPYLVVPEDENGSILEAIVTRYTETEKPASTDAESNNGFIGSYTQELLSQSANLYIVYNNEFRRVGNNVSVGANRAYIDLTKVRDDDPQQGVVNAPHRISLRNSNGGTPTDISNIREEFGNTNKAIKVFHDGNIYFLRESKIYNAQGAELK